ncbi:hypothetical protein CMO96_00340 [Candidatus Woesebacteria bacterium]|nr:hypothetical protein [Candidatus Woesebacteria bacterium]|tara:strand:- start:200 stop:502 length:303 start_codon:yes stop_codon:yes gene_type:complete
MTIKEAIDKTLPAVSEEYNVTREELMGRSRVYHLSEARFVLWKFLRDAPFGLVKISKPFGRDHTTIKHGVRRITEVMEYDRHVRERFENVKLRMNGGKND